MGPNLGVAFQRGGRLAIGSLDLDCVQDMWPREGGGSVTDDRRCRDGHEGVLWGVVGGGDWSVVDRHLTASFIFLMRKG